VVAVEAPGYPLRSAPVYDIAVGQVSVHAMYTTESLLLVQHAESCLLKPLVCSSALSVAQSFSIWHCRDNDAAAAAIVEC
jgi:hypothetical protein